MVPFRYWLEEHRRFFLFLLVVFLLGSLGSGIYFGIQYYLWKEEQDPLPNLVSKEEKEKVEEKEEQEEKEDEPLLFLVDIKGAVSQPGVYEMKEGSRVQDVITVAGGLLENADVSLINLSKKVEDEMVIYVYTKEEVAALSPKETPLPTCPSTPIENDACISENASSSNSLTVSLNNASLEELMQLPGIGQKKAEAILSYREEKGGFQQVEELLNVSGIGEAIFNEIREFLTL